MSDSPTLPSNPPFQSIDFSELSKSERYFFMTSAIVPRPIAVVSTLNPNGIDNLAPFSYFNAVSSDPPCLMFSVSQKRDRTTGTLIEKDTLRNIRHLPEFVVHLAHATQLDWVDSTGDDLPFGESERKKLGLHLAPSRWVQVPRVVEFPIALECRLEKLVDLNGTTIVIGRILGVHYRADLREPPKAEHDHRIDVQQLNPLARLGRRYTAIRPLPEKK